ncbi:hypothetical protein G5C51_41305 [Streptomyces sp. A7024]|uniref:Carrier domain-containing protein n=1 Tax=Streptomyces coryli TaxID=1128680 RepID=A0A6G4UDL1_9ACTN|nr:phosphopantetheine-binding protein [Streptomyces coryli]NGN70309.1 hypothetical protein [Streptomyces coryli]
MSDVSRAQVLEEIRSIAARDWEVDAGAVQEDTVIADLANVDSVKQMRAAATMEQHYGITFLNEDTKPAATVGGFVDQVMGGLATKGQ